MIHAVNLLTQYAAFSQLCPWFDTLVDCFELAKKKED